MKAPSLLLFAALLALSGCAPHFSLFPAKPATSLAPAEPAPLAVPAAKTLAAVDAHTEAVTLAAVQAIAKASATLRHSATTTQCKTLDEIDAAVATVLAEVKAHPSAAVGKTLVKQATQIDADNAPDTRVLAAFYILSFLCFAAAAIAQFARAWLVTVPLVGVFLSDLIGPRILKLLVVIGAGFFALARAYAWCARHPHWVDAFAVLIAATIGIAYANTVDAGWFAKAEAWLKSKFQRAVPVGG